MSEKPKQKAKPAKNSTATANEPSRKEGGPSDSPSFIVGIGGSAGSLEALEEFFRQIPSDTDMGFVVIQHMDPDRKPLLAEILGRSASLPSVEAEDGMPVAGGRIHVIPQNADLGIRAGVLQLVKPGEPRGHRMPIDYFFRQLAEDQKEKAVGVVLAGMGSDGTLGVRAIKGALGMAMAQDPESIQFNSMPNSAIASGAVDYVGAPRVLADLLLEYKANSGVLLEETAGEEGRRSGALGAIFELLRARVGHDFAQYKKNTILRRIHRRMSLQGLKTLEEYVHFIREHPQESEMLFREFLIGVTSFFRDKEAFEVLKRISVPEILSNRDPDEDIRVWVPGCSTGEEAYSVAIALKEALEDLPERKGFKIQIFATDIDGNAVEKARHGVYPESIAQDVSEERLAQFFTRQGGTYRIRQDLREMVIFAQQNLISDPPFTKLDLLCCRNLLIYLTSELQRKLIPLFHYALRPGGILFLGTSETLGTYGDIFITLDNRFKIYRKRDIGPRTVATDFTQVGFFPEKRPHSSLDAEREPQVGRGFGDAVNKLLLDEFSPPAVLINPGGDILYINGRTGKYLEPATGRASLNAFTMAREGLRFELTAAVRKAQEEQKPVKLANLRVKTNGDYQNVDLLVRPLVASKAMQGLLLVAFQPSKKVRAVGRRKAMRDESQLEIVSGLESEVQRARQELQTTVEEMEASQEELKSANEELQSTNEELQSTNEELTTSKEELQSLNEELVTVNSELQNKIEELSQTNSDMRNLLNATQIATLFLDRELRVKRYTPPAEKIVNLISSDVGRPLTHLSTNLEEDTLVADARDVLDTLVFKERKVRAKDGHWYLMRIHPYRTIENVIDGAVVTFVDINPMAELEQSLSQARKFADAVVDTVRHPLVVLDDEMHILMANRIFYRTFHYLSEETKGKSLFKIDKGQWDLPDLRRLLEDILPGNSRVDDYLVEADFPRIGKRSFLLNAHQLLQEGKKTHTVFLALEDITGKTSG